MHIILKIAHKPLKDAALNGVNAYIVFLVIIMVLIVEDGFFFFLSFFLIFILKKFL